MLSTQTIYVAMRAIRVDWWIKLLFVLPYRHPRWVDFCPAFVHKKHVAKRTRIDGSELVTFCRPNSKHTSTHIVFFHGGGYVLPAFKVHWQWVADCVDRLGCTATMVRYPLAPENGWERTVETAIRSYQTIAEQYPDHDMILMGDSAGAGLAMVLNAALKQQSQHQHQHHNQAEKQRVQMPTGLVLLSPWLDLSNKLEQSKTSVIQESRCYGRLAHRSALRYARTTQLQHAQLSPLYGDLSALPATLVLYGENDLVAEDCQRLKTLLAENKAQGGGEVTTPKQVTFEAYTGMGHVWFFLPIVERQKALEQVCGFVQTIVAR